MLRVKRPDPPRPFRVPAAPVVCSLGMTFSLLLMVSLPAATWLRLAVWLAAGMAVYIGYGRRHSRIAGGENQTAR
jgi:APA family basic amino acid/polyamine antiporter